MKYAFRSLAAILLFSLCLSACTPAVAPSETPPPTTQETATSVPSAPTLPQAASEAEKSLLLSLYQNKTAYHGELHDHADTGGTSDGHNPLSQWKEELSALEMDFAAIVDHKQVLHMYLNDWDSSVFIGGTEAATTVESKFRFHYNMIFSDPKDLEEILTEFSEFKFTGGTEGHFSYPRFTATRFRALIDAVKAKGGFFAIVHPRQSEASIPALDFWYRDYTGLEVFYQHRNDARSKLNYKLWVELLSLDKRIWATAGTDKHRSASANALTTVYAASPDSSAYLDSIRTGNFTCGSVGIRMAVGDTVMGSSTSFEGKKLIVSVGDFHPIADKPEHRYRVEILNETGVAYSAPLTYGETSYFAVDAGNARFWRVEVINENTLNMRIALGNPIWNDDPVTKP